jgi:hypothetical protein
MNNFTLNLVIEELNKQTLSNLILLCEKEDINYNENKVDDTISELAVKLLNIRKGEMNNNKYDYLVYLICLKARLLKTNALQYPLNLDIPNKKEIEQRVKSEVDDTDITGVTVLIINEQILNELKKLKNDL